MAFVKVQVKDRDVRRALKRMKKAGRDLGPVLRKLRKPLISELSEAAATESAPDGQWAPLAPSTIKKRRGSKRWKRSIGKRPTLGKVPELSRVSVRGKKHLGLWNKIKWARAHNEGAVVGGGSNVPARPFAFLSDPFLERADEAILDHVMKKWGA